MSAFLDKDDNIRTGRVVFALIGAILAVGVLGSLIGLASGWWNAGVQVVSASNVKEQYAQAINEWESLKTSAFNACSAQSAETDENSPTFVEGPELAYAATYRRSVVEYNSRMKNIFEAKLVGPSGYPREVPRLDVGPTTDWCSVSEELASIK